MPRSLLAGLAVVLLAPSLTGCGSDDGGDGVQVAAGFYALEYVAERIGGDHVEVTTLAQPGQEPHDAELTVAQTAEVLDADLVLHALGFQPALDEVAQDADEDAVVEALDVLRTRDPAIGGAPPVTVLEGDPHFWLDPRALATVGEEVQDRLVEIDPAHAEDYRTRTAELVGDLVGIDGRFATGLDGCERRTVVTSHDAFGYLGYRYDLALESVAGLSPDAEPSPRHLADLADLVSEEGVTTVFTERLVGPELAETLSRELGLETAVLDPVEGLSDETADDDYLTLMDANLEALQEANGCR
jgi:zinc transport system substrate-binding protein